MTGKEKDGLRVAVDAGRLRRLDWRGLAVRFAFGAAIAVGSALVGTRFGHRAGGLFLSFPAILPASLTLIADRHGDHPAKVNAIGAILGGVALAGFAGVAFLLLARAPVLLTLAAASAAWLAAAVALYFAAAFVLTIAGRHPEAPDRPGSLRRRTSS